MHISKSSEDYICKANVLPLWPSAHSATWAQMSKNKKEKGEGGERERETERHIGRGDEKHIKFTDPCGWPSWVSTYFTGGHKRVD